MRSIVCRYESAEALRAALESNEHELVPARRKRSADAAPESSRGLADGEWVLAIVELVSLGQATAAAARVRRHGEQLTLAFEPRDWRRLEELGARAPATDRSPGTTGSVVRKVSEATRARVLLVDDDAAVRDVVSAMLEAVGLVVTAASTAEQALELLQASPFDIALFDWTLPGMSGLELCRTVRARWTRLPVLFLTAHATSTDMVDAFAGGADDYVVKPFRAPELGARIFGLLRRSAAST